MEDRQVPDIVVGRLPIYLRALTFLKADSREITSSQELGDRLGISSAQIRKDLSHFGEFGKQGTGYDIKHLESNLKEILHVDRMWDVVVVGAGDLGHALAGYRGFAGRGFRITAVFDKDQAKIGQTTLFETLEHHLQCRNTTGVLACGAAHACMRMQCISRARLLQVSIHYHRYGWSC
jgi:redox-sensing transcriptional repressor